MGINLGKTKVMKHLKATMPSADQGMPKATAECGIFKLLG
jgi:hypothetical protein